jgi:rod shape-determining protein MreC
VALTHRRSRGRYVVAALLLASLTLITLDTRGSGALRSVRNHTQSVLSPVESGIHDALRPVGNFFAGAADFGSLKAENERLRSEYAGVQAQEAQNQYEEQQLKEAYKQLDLPYAAGIKPIVANVTTQPSSNFEVTITIDKGTSAGVALKQPVVGSAGLLGTVTAAGSGTATVTLLTNPGATIAVTTVSGADLGYVKGQGLDKDLEMTVLPDSGKVAPLKVGQELYTSDVGSAYPSGIPVGRVKTVTNDGANTTATVAPLANAGNLSFVDVMLWSGQ